MNCANLFLRIIAKGGVQKFAFFANVPKFAFMDGLFNRVKPTTPRQRNILKKMGSCPRYKLKLFKRENPKLWVGFMGVLAIVERNAWK